MATESSPPASGWQRDRWGLPAWAWVVAAVAMVAAFAVAMVVFRGDDSGPTVVPMGAGAIDPGTSPTVTPPPEAELPDVPWGNYDPEFVAYIHGLYEDAECDKMQSEFFAAFDNDPAQRERTGDGNAQLMRWLDTAMAKAGCFDR